jgi:hypothetical protein
MNNSAREVVTMTRKMMVLHAATNNVGSECQCELGVTETEWSLMSEQDQDALVNEFKANVLETWVEAE